MTIKNILADGTEVKDITGHKVTKQEVYDILRKIGGANDKAQSESKTAS